MTYITNNTTIPGLKIPVQRADISLAARNGFQQTGRIEGSVNMFFPESSWSQSNSESMGAPFGSASPFNFNPVLNMPQSIDFNFGSSGGGGSTTVVSGDSWIGVTGSGSPYTITFDPSGMCAYLTAQACNLGGSTFDYFAYMGAQTGPAIGAASPADSFQIIGDYVSGPPESGYIETVNNGTQMEVLFKRKLFEQIYDGNSGYAIPASQNDVLNFSSEFTSYLTINCTSADTVQWSIDIDQIKTDTDQNLFSTIRADNGSDITANNTADLLSFKYDTDGGDYDNSIVITSDPGTDTVKFKLDMDVVQRSAASTCMVLLTSQVGVSSPPGFSLSITGMKYSGTAFITDFDASTNTTTVTNQTVDVWDLGYNEGAGWVSDSSGLFVDDPAPATITEQISLAGQWVMATRIHPAYDTNNAAYVTSYFPRLKSECAGSTL